MTLSPRSIFNALATEVLHRLVDCCSRQMEPLMARQGMFLSPLFSELLILLLLLLLLLGRVAGMWYHMDVAILPVQIFVHGHLDP